MSYSAIGFDEIGKALAFASKGTYENEMTRRNTGINFSDELLNEAGIPPEDTGDGVITTGVRHARTLRHLRGSVAKLTKDTLMSYETFTVPEKIDRKNVESLMFDSPPIEQLATISFTLLMLHENKERIKKVGLFSHKFPTLEVAPVVQGLGRYLNGMLPYFQETVHLEEMLEQTRGFIGQIHTENVDRFLESFAKGSNESDH